MGILDGRAFVVTGSGRGLGRAFAREIARQGGAVVVDDVDREEADTAVAEIEREGGVAVASDASVAEWSGAEELITSCERAFGSFDGLVNNAVAFGHFGPAWEDEEERIRRQVEVNLMGSLFCGTRAMRKLRENGRGAILNITSRSSLGIEGMSTYSATKGALVSATYAWASEMMPFGVRVNALTPSAMTRGTTLAGPVINDAVRADAVPPAVVAPAVAYLLSDLSDGVTGQVFAMLGGRLGLYSKQTLLHESERREDWTPADIAEAVEADHRTMFQPLGFNQEYRWSPSGPGRN